MKSIDSNGYIKASSIILVQGTKNDRMWWNSVIKTKTNMTKLNINILRKEPNQDLMNSKTGVNRGIHYFRYFCSKTEIVDTQTHRL